MSKDMRSFGSYTRRIADLEADLETATAINHRLRIERDMARAEVERLTADLNTALGLEPDWKPLSQRYPERFPSRDQR